MTQYRIITKANGHYGIQRVGGTGVYGDFLSYAGACAAIAEAQIADSYRIE